VSSRTLETEAVVLRSLRFGEADRILHLFTKERGRLNAIAKGARRTRSRLGGRLEPFSHAEVRLHEGRGELATVTGAELLRAHHSLALEPQRIAVGHIGVEAVLRLFAEHDASPQAFHALVRFLDLLEQRPRVAGDAALDPLGLSFQLKLLWLAGYLPHLASCASCGSAGPLVAFSAAEGGAVCAECQSNAEPVSAGGFLAIAGMLERPLADADELPWSSGAARDTLRVVQSLYEYHGGFRLRTLSAR
jgi:DNA repair protein RecO (recombination protein O)